MGLRKIFFVYLIIIFFSSSKIFCADWLITTSGTYILSDDLLSTNADSNGAVHIQSSFVTLDLNGRFIYQNNSTASANGIVIDSGLTDIIVKNGIIVNFTRCGVTLNSGCSRIKLQNLIIESCKIRGIELNGTSSNMITQSEVNNCKIFACCSSSSADNVMTIAQCQDVLVTGCELSANAAVAINQFVLINLNNSSNCTIKNTVMRKNSSSGTGSSPLFYGVGLNAIKSCYFSKCFFINNSTTANYIGGFTILGSDTTSTNNVFEDCMVLNCSCTVTTPSGAVPFATGFYTSDFSVNSGGMKKPVFRRCLVNGLKVNGNGSGGRIDAIGVTSTTDSAVIQDCYAMSSSGPGSTNQGFNVNTASGIMTTSGALYCSAASATACVVTGLQFAGSSNWLVRDCDIIQNLNNGTGVGITTGTNDIFSNNLSMEVTGGGPSSTSVTSLTMNTPTSPWTNLLATS